MAVSALADQTLKVWEIESGRELRTLRGHTAEVSGVALSGDERLAASASVDQTLKVWDLQKGCEVQTLVGHTDWAVSVALNFEGNIGVSNAAVDDGLLRVWDLEHGKLLRLIRGHTVSIGPVAATPNGEIAISAMYDHTVTVWNIGSGHEIHRLKMHAGPVTGLASSSDGRLIVLVDRSYGKGVGT